VFGVGAARRRNTSDPEGGMCMRGRRWLAVAIAVGSISTGVAVAGGGSSETSPVIGDFHADLKKQKQHACDANHTRITARFKGDQHSNDARLDGDFQADATSVVSDENGWGRTEGTVVIRERGHHRHVMFRGEFIGVIEPDGAEGFLTGDTTDRPSARLFANFNVDQDPDTGAITGEFGKDSQKDKPYAPEDQDPAILTNACFGHHHHGGGHHH
jgi:hypothetical protein